MRLAGYMISWCSQIAGRKPLQEFEQHEGARVAREVKLNIATMQCQPVLTEDGLTVGD